jgi:hypothetical protein
MGGVAVMTADVLADSVNVVWTPEVICGDLSALEGLTVTARHDWYMTLLWESVMRLGASPTYDTELSLHASSNALYESIPDQISPVYVGFSMSDDYMELMSSEFEPYQDKHGIYAEYRRLFDSIPNGGTAIGTYSLRDYTDRIPMWFTYGLPDVTPSDNWQYDENERDPWTETAYRIADYFALPLKGDPLIRLTVVREGDTLVSNDHHIIGAPYDVTTVSFATDEAVYVAFRFKGDTDMVDLDAMAEGQGVYRVPLDMSQKGPERFLVDSITRFYPLESHIRVLQMKPDPVTGHLILLTENEGQFSLLAVDKTDGHLLGETPLESIDTEQYSAIVQKDVIILIDNYRIQVLARKESGAYGLDSVILPQEHLHWEDSRIFNDYNLTFAYDGERLAILENDVVLGLRIRVVEDGVVTAHVVFSNSLQKEQYYDPICAPLLPRQKGLEAEWRN